MATMQNRKVALVGVSLGLGASLAHALSGEGASVFISSRNEGKINDIARTMKQAGNITAIPGNVATPEGSLGLATKIKEKAGKLDGLCILVGGYEADSITNPHALDTMLNNNVKAVIYAVSAFIDMMGKNSSIVLVSNAASLDHGSSASMSYSIAKGAVIRIADLLCAQLIPRSIRVNVVAPSFIDGNFILGRDYLSLRKIGEFRVPPEGISDVIVFLLSDRSSWVNGAVIPVDGGHRFIKV